MLLKNCLVAYMSLEHQRSYCIIHANQNLTKKIFHIEYTTIVSWKYMLSAIGTQTGAPGLYIDLLEIENSSQLNGIFSTDSPQEMMEEE